MPQKPWPEDARMAIAHEKIEKNIGLLAVLVAVVVSLGPTDPTGTRASG